MAPAAVPSESEVPLGHLAASRLMTNQDGLVHFLQKIQAENKSAQVQPGTISASAYKSPFVESNLATKHSMVASAYKSPLIGCRASDTIWTYQPHNVTVDRLQQETQKLRTALAKSAPSQTHRTCNGDSWDSQDKDEDDDYEELTSISHIGHPVEHNAWTTLMIRKISAAYTQEMLAAEWANNGTYDFLFVPTKSYAFVNFTSEGAALQFMQTWQNTRLSQDDTSKKSLHIRFSFDQGLENNLRRWRKKRTWRLTDRARPMVFRSGMQVNVEEMMEVLGLRPAAGLGPTKPAVGDEISISL
jgi:hypothetical protein